MARAKFNSDDKSILNYSWPAQTTDILSSDRKTRSGRPEILYHLGPDTLESPVIVKQPVIGPVSSPVVPPQFESQSSIDSEDGAEHLDSGSATENDQNFDDIDEQYDRDSDETMDEKSFSPTTFSGGLSDDADDWFRQFNNYCSYKGYNDNKQLALFKVWTIGLRNSLSNYMRRYITLKLKLKRRIRDSMINLML